MRELSAFEGVRIKNAKSLVTLSEVDLVSQKRDAII